MRLSYLILSFFFIASCSTVPLTGRKQFALLPGDQLDSMARQNYHQLLQKSVLSQNQESIRILRRVGERVKKAVVSYMKETGRYDLIADYDWEFNLIKNDDVINAFAMPGGKVAFYTGILPICQNETGIAVVMGHEIAHVIAQHGNERMTAALTAQLGGVALAVAFREKPQLTQQLVQQAYGLGVTVGGMLPFSRFQESEADYLGLIFMAKAGYDPREAPGFWRRMKKKSGGTPPTFLSTHPAPESRVENLQKWLPEALKHYQK